MSKTYRVWSYDVWGNDEDGYSVNDRSEIDSGEFSPDKTDDENISEIIDNNFDVTEVEIDNGISSDENIEIVLKSDGGYPVGQIEIEEVI